MKVCMITRTYPPRLGGPGAVVHKVSKFLVNEGFDISVVTQNIGSAPKFEDDAGVKVFRTAVLNDKKEFGMGNLGVGIGAMTKRILQCRNHDFFHAHDISVAGFSGALAKQVLSKKPFFIKYGGDLVMEYLGLKKIQGWDPKLGLEGTLKFKTGMAGKLHGIQDWYFKGYDLILPDSEYGKDFLLRRGGAAPDKIKVLVNGTDTEVFRPAKSKTALRKELGLSGKTIFTAARMVEWKGYDVLIKALSQIKDKDVNLVMGGTGPEEDKLKVLAKGLGVQDRIKFPGSIAREDMPRYLAASDVFVMPSYFDTTPNSVIEAMACGAPIVISDIDGMKDLADDGCGLRAGVADADDFAEKLKTVLGDAKLRQRMSKACIKKIDDNYSWKIVLKQYKELYENWD